jgi:uncharacterized protein with ParB-like and HNH nuclease domain
MGDMMLAGDICIRDFIESFDSDNILLPMIQRPFVWDEGRIEHLFDSVIKKFPFGIILLYKRQKDNFIIYGRHFFKEIEDGMNYENYDTEVGPGKILVLDGHQRLQSLYLGYKGYKFKGKKLYYDINYFNQVHNISDVSFKLINSDKIAIKQNESIFILFSRVLEIAGRIHRVQPQQEKEEERIIQEMTDIFHDIGVTGEQILKFYNHINRYIANSVFFQTDTKIFRYLLIDDFEFDNVLEIFVRFNQGGLSLTKSDLLFSTLKLKWKDAGKSFQDLSEDTEINKDMLLKTAIVTSNYKADMKLSNLENMHINTIKDNFPSFKEVIEQFHDRVKSLTDQYTRIYWKYNFLIPIIYYLYKRKESGSYNIVLDSAILKYLLIIVYNSNLRSDNHLNEIIKRIDNEREDATKQSRTPNFPIDSINKYLKDMGVKVDIDELSLNSDPILTFSLIQRNNWNPLSYKNSLQIDHIFPQSEKEKLPLGAQDYVDSIWNKYVVFAGDNIRKKAIMPDKYFKGKKEKYIDEYILKKDLLAINKFKELIKWRKKIIIKMFKSKLDIEIK